MKSKMALKFPREQITFARSSILSLYNQAANAANNSKYSRKQF